MQNAAITKTSWSSWGPLAQTVTPKKNTSVDYCDSFNSVDDSNSLVSFTHVSLLLSFSTPQSLHTFYPPFLFSSKPCFSADGISLNPYLFAFQYCE
jgi:hypothetical protein